MLINSQIGFGLELPRAEQSVIKAEPMLYRADREFARKHGGPLTRSFLRCLDQMSILPGLVIDSRVHMLMPGMYPCIPGWHHDDVPRTRSDGQPNYEVPSQVAHFMALYGDCSLTQFALGEAEFEVPPIGSKIYKSWSPIVDRMIDSRRLVLATPPPHRIIFFNDRTWHRGTAATHTGFRFFIRASMNATYKPANEVRFNANTYMPVLEEGW